LCLSVNICFVEKQVQLEEDATADIAEEKICVQCGTKEEAPVEDRVKDTGPMEGNSEENLQIHP
jgi:hypothetical protein